MDLTPLLRLYARRRIARLRVQDPAAAQERHLAKLLEKGARTRFGADHRFTEIRSVADYQRQVPVRTYEDFWRDYWEPCFPHLVDCTWPGRVRFFAETSGTATGKTKFIPYTEAMNRSNMRAIADVYVHHLANRPASRILAGRTVVLYGATALKAQAPGAYSGDLTGIGSAKTPWWARPWHGGAHELAPAADWEGRIDRLAGVATGRKTRCIAGYPSWLLYFFDRVSRVRASPPSLRDFFPELELLVHGGVHFGPYRKIFDDLLAGSRAELREVYPASEGFIAIADRQPGEGLRLLTDNGLFFEFVPVRELGNPHPTRHWLADVELGEEYAVVLSTCAGAWSYAIGDTVRFLGRNPPRIVMTGRTGQTLSAFGEHLTGAEIEESVAAAAASLGVGVADFCVAPIFPERPGERGGHLFVVEFAPPVSETPRLETFARRLDAELCRVNDDYRVYRTNGAGLRAPTVLAARPKTFALWMKRRGKLGGQNKVPRILNDADLAKNLKEFTTELRGR